MDDALSEEFFADLVYSINICSLIFVIAKSCQIQIDQNKKKESFFLVIDYFFCKKS